MSKNICIVTTGLSGGGVARVVLSLAQAFYKLNCRVDIFVLDFDARNSYPTNEFDFNIHIVNKKKSSCSAKKLEQVVRYIEAIQNIKHLKNKISEVGVSFDLTISNKLLTDISCKKLNLPNTNYCIHTSLSQSFGFDKKNTIFRFIRSFLIRQTYKNQDLITVSKGVKQDLLKFGVQPKTIKTIYNPFDFNKIRQQSKEYQVYEQDYVIHVGYFRMVKRHDILIKAYKQSGIEQKLLLFGYDSESNGKNARQLVLDLGLQGKVFFKGFNPNPYPYIKNAKAMILSSDFEGLPTVLIESLILGTPVVSTNCPSGPSEILIDELKPFLSPVGDVNALAKNIKKMVENPIKITDKYINRFSAEKSVAQYLALCN